MLLSSTEDVSPSPDFTARVLSSVEGDAEEQVLGGHFIESLQPPRVDDRFTQRVMARVRVKALNISRRRVLAVGAAAVAVVFVLCIVVVNSHQGDKPVLRLQDIAARVRHVASLLTPSYWVKRATDASPRSPHHKALESAGMAEQEQKNSFAPAEAYREPIEGKRKTAPARE